MARQQRKLDHVIFAGATHEPAARLSKRLSELTQNHLSRVFYTDNGSCAVEVALKIALQSWTNQDRKRHRRVLSFHGSYHGDTFGTMAAAAAEPFHGAFRDLMFQPLTAAPATLHPTAFNPVGKGMLDQRCNELKNLFERYHDDLGAVILEPMLQGASGMNVQDPVWLRLLDQLCHDYEIPLILDEVFTGMGRSADYFAFHREHLHPDIVCIAKGLTGGTLPLAATLVTEDLFENFYSDDRRKALYHGHTFTANAIACAAALATLELYGQKQLISRARQLETRFQSWLRDHQDDLGLAHPRSYGAVMAWEVAGSGPKDYFSQLALRVPQLAEAHGLWLRPLGNTIYFAPPLTITDEELDFALDGLRQVMTTLRS
jgi:adenosylmethionine-8-amino-7-oxononanoate aminotransferase